MIFYFYSQITLNEWEKNEEKKISKFDIISKICCHSKQRTKKWENKCQNMDEFDGRVLICFWRLMYLLQSQQTITHSFCCFLCSFEKYIFTMFRWLFAFTAAFLARLQPQTHNHNQARFFCSHSLCHNNCLTHRLHA